MPENGRAAENEPSTEEMQAEFIDRCGLTPREIDVLRAVTSDERLLKQVADELGMSLRMVQRHLTSGDADISLDRLRRQP